MALTRAEVSFRYRERHKNDPEYKSRRSAQACAWAKANPERANANAARWRANNPRKRKDVILKNRYCRIRRGQYDVRFVEQSGLCAMCSVPAIGRSLELDH